MVLGLIIFIAYRIYFEPVLLCDDNGLMLYNLKTELYSEVAKYKTSDIEIAEYNRKLTELKKFSQPNFRNFGCEEIYTNSYKNAITKHNEASTKINQLEAAIKIFEPGFKSFRYSK
jgi:hypothetical protein